MVEHFSRWGPEGQRVLVTDVPALRCVRCGMVLFENDVAQRLEDLVRGAEGEPLTIVVARYGG